MVRAGIYLFSVLLFSLNLFAQQLIINSTLDLWRRGTVFTGASNIYTADRFQIIENSAAVVDVFRNGVTVPNVRSNYAFQVDVTTADAVVDAGDNVSIQYRIEGFDLLPIADRTFNLTWQVRSPKTGTHCVAFRNVSDNRSYVVEYTVNSADTFEKKSISLKHDSTGVWDFTTAIGMKIDFVLMAGANFQTGTPGVWTATSDICTASGANAVDNIANNFFIARIRLNPGSQTKGLVLAGGTIAGEEQLADKYFRILPFAGRADGTSTLSIGKSLSPPMRANPTIFQIDSGATGGNILNNIFRIGVGNVAVTAAGFRGAAIFGFEAITFSGTPLVAGDFYIGDIALDAEL